MPQNIANQHVRATPRELTSFKIGAIWAGVADGASYKSDWLRAVGIFSKNVTNPDFIAGITSRPEQLDKFIGLLNKRHGFTVTKESLSRFLTSRETFKRLYMHDREHMILPWVQNLPDPQIQARILESQPWVYNILRKHGDRKTSKQVFNLLNGLEPGALATLLQNYDPPNLSMIREKMTKRDMHALIKVSGLKIK